MTNESWVARAETLLPMLAEHADRHDQDASFVVESYRRFREEKVFSAGVPSELGGGGAGYAEICDVLRVLAHGCGSSALALSMHTHLIATNVWRHKHGQPAEALLRKVADKELVLVSTGAGDWLESNSELTEVPGGYRLTGKKIFCSGSPMGNLMITSARFEDPKDGPSVLHFPVPLSAEGVTILDDWNTLGMRGTGSCTVKLEQVFVPAESIALRRPRKGWHPAFNVIVTVALPVLAAPYLGLAERAAEIARQKTAAKREDPGVQHLIGAMESALDNARVLWRAMVAHVQEYEVLPSLESANLAAMRKTRLVYAAREVLDRAMEAVGGGAFFRTLGLERILRDVYAGIYHPLQPERQALFSGRLALGLDPIG